MNFNSITIFVIVDLFVNYDHLKISKGLKYEYVVAL
jgi:hypothetical protein